MQPRIYFDHNASAPLLPAARKAMLAALELHGNASSIHGEGRALRAIVESARETVAACLSCTPREIVFTSGATEAAALALTPHLVDRGEAVTCGALYVSAIEHPCILAGGRFPAGRVHTVPANADGLVDCDALAASLAGHECGSGPPMVAVMLANNETGAVQPVARIGEIVRRHGGYLVVDAVQAFRRRAFSVRDLPADMVILSSHKIGGPQGAGALVLERSSLSPAPLLAGGGQEYRHRAGTENVAGIAGFAAAAREAPALESSERIRTLRDFIEADLRTISGERPERVAQPVIFAQGSERLGNTLCFAVRGISAETALIALDLAGIAISSGSACSSGKVGRSHVLAAMGIDDELAGCALRISLGPSNEFAEAHLFADAWRNIVGQSVRAARRIAV